MTQQSAEAERLPPRKPWTDAAIWSAGFRPFFLGGAIYGPLTILFWLAAYAGLLSPSPGTWPLNLWHGHELLCGYGAAVITGFVITGIPSWGECRPIDRGPLALLFLVWLTGRVAMWLTPVLPTAVVAALDLAFFPLLAVLITPSLLESRYKAFIAILVILAAFFTGNLLFHLGVAGGDETAARFGLRLFLYAIIVLYTLVGGFLTPIFTQTELGNDGWQGRIRFIIPLEVLAVLTVLAYAATGLYAPASTLSGVAAILAFAVHGVRMARWQGHRTLGHPLLWVMNLSYLWFLTSVALRAIGDLWGLAPDMASVHAFTVGAFGLMKIGFLTRVALRHTGRPLKPHGLMVLAFGLMFMAALSRLAAAYGLEPGILMMLSTLLWALPFVMYVAVHGAMLVRSSLPYRQE
ncbi:MAG: NnrS family protein [Sphingomonadales bacterium]